MHFEAALQDLLVANKDYIESGALRTEEDTKRVLIVPFFEALGYDTRNPVEFRSEVSSVGGGRVDYAICHGDKPVIIIECKAAANNRLIDDRGQLRRYFNASKPIVGVLTNGIQYQFFGDLDVDGSMDAEPFLEVDLEGLDAEDFDDGDAPMINALSVFTKAELNPETLLDAATTFKYKRGMRKFLDEQFNGNELNRELVEVLAKQVYSRRLGSVVRESLSQLAKEVINELKADLAKPAVTGSRSDTKVEEREGYYIVKNILWDVVDGDRVVMQDHQTYCTIQLDQGQRSRKRICLLRFNRSDRKRIGLLDAGAEEQLSIDHLPEINKYSDRIRATALRILENEK